MAKNIDAITVQIEKMEIRLKQLKEQKAKSERMAKAAEKRQTRANDTRRKILIGAMILNRVEKGALDIQQVKDHLDAFLVKDADRKLFGLPVIGSK